MNLKNKFLKFIGAGVINTIASYLVYLLLVLFLNYQVSYAIAFVFGIIEGIKVTPFADNLPAAVQNLPLNAQNLAWLIPSCIVLLICIVIDKIRKSS